MKLINETRWRNDDLRAIILRAFKEFEVSPKGYTVKVVHARQRLGGSGCATIGGRWFKVRFANPHLFSCEDAMRTALGDFAHVVEHELQHTMGFTHAEMRDGGSMNSASQRVVPDWIKGMTLRAKQEKKITLSERVDARADKARRMLERWERKVRLAKTIRAKWAAKVRYYERKAAASPARSEVAP